MKKLLILGCRMSGTTLLTSLLGAHSKINMLNESYDKCVDKLAGKVYQGVKMVIPYIFWNKRATLLRMIIYKKLAFVFKALKKTGIRIDFHKGSSYSIMDFVKGGAKIVFITRGETSCMNSMIERSGISYKQALKTYHKSADIGVYLLKYNVCYVSMEDLTKSKASTIRELKRICEYLGIKYEGNMLLSSGLNNTYKNPIIEKKK